MWRARAGAWRPRWRRLQAAGIRVSLFIDPDLPQVEAAARIGAEMVELHTGCFANASEDWRTGRDRAAGLGGPVRRTRPGIQVNAGHGINYRQPARPVRRCRTWSN